MKTLKSLAVALLVLGLSGCDGFLDVNVDPDTATAVPAGQLLTYAVVQSNANRALELGMATSLHSQSWAGNASIGNWSSQENGNPLAGLSTVNNTWLFMYVDVHKNTFIGIDQALEEGRPNEAAQLRLYSAFEFYNTTMLWERIPFTEALDPVEFPTPSFDDQRTVLYGVIDMVNQALGELNPQDPNRITRQDPIFGDLSAHANAARQIERWERFGNSLKLLAYTALRGGGENVDAEIQALITGDRLITVHTDNAYVRFGGGSTNPRTRMQLNFWPGSENWFWPGGPLVQIMNDNEDPRRPVYMYPAEDGAFRTGFVGASCRPFNNCSRVNRTTYLREAMPVPLITADEVNFLIAEHYARGGNLTDADTRFRAAINAAFDALPVVAGQGVTAAERSTFLAGFPSLTGMQQQDALMAIWRQHYVSLFYRGEPSWNLVRRVGETVFGLRIAAAHALNTYLARYPYPVSEITTNPLTPENPPLDEKMWFQSGAITVTP